MQSTYRKDMKRSGEEKPLRQMARQFRAVAEEQSLQYPDMIGPVLQTMLQDPRTGASGFALKLEVNGCAVFQRLGGLSNGWMAGPGVGDIGVRPQVKS